MIAMKWMQRNVVRWYVLASNATPSTSTGQLQKGFTTKSIKVLSTYDDFIASCCDQGLLSENNKERSKRVLINIELKYFRTSTQKFNLKSRPPTTSAINSRKAHYVQLPVLSILAKVHSVTCGKWSSNWVSFFVFCIFCFPKTFTSSWREFSLFYLLKR